MQIVTTLEALRAMSWCAARKDERRYLNSVYIECNPQETRLVATDGHIAGCYQQTMMLSDCTANVIVPIETVDAILRVKVGRGHGGMVLFTETAGAWAVKVHETTLGFVPYDDRYPDYRRRVFPVAASGEVSRIDPALLNRAQLAARAFRPGAWAEVMHNGEATCPIYTPIEGLAICIATMRRTEGQPTPTIPQWVTAPLAPALAVTAVVSPDVAAAFDPDGSLRAAGLMEVQS